MRIASVDIGTNTVLLLIADVDASGTITTLSYEQRIPRLGKGVDASKNLHPDSMRRVVDVLLEYASIMQEFHPGRVVVAGTSAVRDAGNREDLARLVAEKTGFQLEILTGADEALWTYRGAISGIADIDRATVIDIGGGSTEITVGSKRNVLHSISLDIGSVRLTERLFKHDPPTSRELEAAIAVVEDELQKAARFDFRNSTLVAVAGTSAALAVLAQGLKEFSLDAVRNYVMHVESVEGLFRRLRKMPSEEIRRLSTVMNGRSDIITAGALMLREIMAHFKFEKMIVSERGVRYGLVLREWERSSQP